MKVNNMGTETRGFASLKLRDPERLKQICSKGGIEAHRLNRGHEWSSSEASKASYKRKNITKRDK